MTTRLLLYCMPCLALVACRAAQAPSHVDAAPSSAKVATDAGAARAADARRDARPTLAHDGGATDVEVLPLPSTGELDAITRRLCRGDRHCCRLDAASAGSDRKGRAMTIVRLDRTCGQKTREEDGVPCQHIENWLGVHTGPRLHARQLLTEECNDGYGASGMGEDSSETARNAFSAGRSGGSGYYWASSVDMVLDPLHVAATSQSSFWRTRSDSAWEERWSWDGFAGSGALKLEVCEDEDAPKAAAPAADQDAAPGAPEGKYVLIPEVELTPEFLGGGWKTTALGRCSVFVDGQSNGFTIHGTGQGAADASMRVVAGMDDSQQVLFVEIWDDHWVGPGRPVAGRTWLHDDHLEIWAGDGPNFFDGCTKREQGSPRQWAIRISDGQVFSALGSSTKLPQAESVLPAAGRGSARVRIALPPMGEGDDRLTVVYSDSDDGKRQKQLIATSDVKRGWAVTFGVIRAAGATCHPRKGRLEVSLTPEKTEPDKAMFEF